VEFSDGKLRATVLAFAAVGFSACSGPDLKETTERRSMAITGETVDVPKEQSFLHSLSGLEFPPEIIAFDRGDIVSYDRNLKSIRVSYWIVRAGDDVRQQELLASVYIYPRISDGWSPELNTHWEELMNAVTALYPEALLTSGLPSPLEDGRSPAEQWTEANYGRGTILSINTEWHDRGSLETLTHLYLFGTNEWYLKYRISYPKDEWPYTEHHVAALMKTIGLPK